MFVWAIQLLLLMFLTLRNSYITAETCSERNVKQYIKDAVQETTESAIQMMIEAVNALGPQVDPQLGLRADKPAESCKQLKELNPSLPSGDYWISPSDPAQVRCEMNFTCTSGEKSHTGVWMRVADLDMTKQATCPIGLRLVTQSSKRLCGYHSLGTVGCSSVWYSSHGANYSRVCGKIIGYQKGRTLAFAQYPEQAQINYPYVYGISLVRGPYASREHVWTFANAADDIRYNERYKCPCINKNNNPSKTKTPTFIGNDYFCDTGIKGRSLDYVSSTTLFTEDPLWDGEGCAATNTCCNFPGGDVKPPWFYKDLLISSKDTMEMRLCHLDSTSETLIESIELYIQ